MRVLVTGNLGYIGPVVTAALKRSHHVIGLDTGWFLPNLASIPVWPDEQVFLDIRDAAARGIDAVVHLAGLSNDPMGALDPFLTGAINTNGTLDLIGSAPFARHLIVSSCSVYGTAGMATEETPTAPLTAYATAKDAVDVRAPRYAENVVSLRLGTVFGWSPGHRLDLVVNRMTYDATHGLGINVNGNAARPLVHVEDVASAIVFMLERPETGIFNVVGENVRIRDLASLVAAETKARIKEQGGGADARDYMADGSKLRALGWAPAHTVESTLPDLAERTADLGTPYRYERLTALKRLITAGYLDNDLRHNTEREAA